MTVRLTVMMLSLAVSFAAGAHAGDARHRESAAPRSDFEIFSVGVDGKHRRNLSRSALDDRFPAVSPDGRRIIFSRWGGSIDDPRTGLWLMNSDGSGQRKIPGIQPFGPLAPPVWSPDGTRVAFMTEGYSPPVGYIDSVFVLRVADSQLTTIEDALYPTWAPDGRRLAFLSESLHSFRAGFQHLSVANADGTNRRVVLTQGGIDSQPVWSTRGSLIALTLPNFLLDVVDAETGQAHQVASEGWGPSWSPDGRRLAFTFYGGLGVTRVAQPNTRLLVSSKRRFFSPRRPIWSPNGRSIAFIAKNQLRVVDVASRRFQVVTRSSTGFGAPSWSPSGRRLYFPARLRA